MEKHHTDDLFKKILEQPPPMRPRIEDLEDMNRRLEEENRKQKKTFFWMLPFLLVLPFLGATAFYYFKYQTANQLIEQLQTKKEIVETKDTVHQRITIYQYDTIKTVIYEEVIAQLPKENTALPTNKGHLPYITFAEKNFYKDDPLKKNNTFDKSSFQPSQLVLLKDEKVLSLSWLKSILQQGTTLKEIDIAKNPKPNWSITEKIGTLSFLVPSLTYQHPLPPNEHFFTLPTIRKRNTNPLGYFIPTGFRGGVSYSPVGRTINSSLTNNMFSWGIIGEIKFTDRTSLQLGIEQLSLSLEAETPQEVALFPPNLPISDTDFLQEVSGNFKYLQLPFTFQYYFHPDKIWNPYVGIGMIARLPIQAQIQYEWASTQGEYRQTSILNNESFSINNLRTALGIEYTFFTDYTLQLEGYYHHSFEATANPFFQLRYGGLNMGLKYNF